LHDGRRGKGLKREVDVEEPVGEPVWDAALTPYLGNSTSIGCNVRQEVLLRWSVLKPVVE